MEKNITTTIEIPKNIKKEIQIKLTTDLNEEYQLTQNIFTVSLDFVPSKLNELVKKMLKLKEERNFGFYINNIKLNESLLEFIKNNNSISTETVLEIYYMFEMNEPQLTNTIKEDEWIRKIEILSEMKYTSNYKNYCVGLFNGEITFYNGENNKIYTLKKTNLLDDECLAMLSGLKFYKNDNNNNSHNLLIRTMKNSNYTFELFDIDLNEQTDNLLYYNTVKEDESFNCCDLCPVNYNIFTIGGSKNKQGLIRMFKLSEDINLNNNKSSPKKSSNNKKRKIEGSNLDPIYTFENLHKSNVFCCSWLNGDYLLSGGDDYLLNLFSAETKNLFMNFSTNYKDINCFLPINYNTFLAGFMDGSIGLYDYKAKNTYVQLFKDKNLYGFVSELSISNDKDNHPNTFISANYDSCIKLWDLRGGNLPLFRVKTDNTEKNYTAKFNGFNTILSGGDGSSINIYNF